ncbi:helix-turn-helix domain-containing protein [Pseudomonas sp. Marseille-QA0892]
MSVLEHVAGNLRHYREARGLSQQALADASAVSRRMIVGIESGEANVSLNTLDRLAAALHIKFADLIQPPTQADHSRIAQLVWQGTHPGSKGTLLATSPAKTDVELWDWQLMPGDAYTSEASPGWHEMLVVIEGTLTVTRSTGRQDVMQGDFLAFASDGFKVSNTTDQPVRFNRVVCY